MAPYDVEPRIHFASCKKRKRDVMSQQESFSAAQADAVAALMQLGIKLTSARGLVERAGDAPDSAVIFAAALRLHDEERRSA